MKKIMVFTLMIVIFGSVFFTTGATKQKSETGLKQPVSDGNNLFAFSHKGKWGYMDRNGKVVIKPKYDFAEQFSENLACVGNITNGRSLAELEDLEYITNQIKYGYINPNGEIVIPFKYSSASSFRNNSAMVRLEIKDYGDDNGIEDDPKYKKRKSHLISANTDIGEGDTTHFINSDGKAFLSIITPKSGNNFSEGLAAMKWYDTSWRNDGRGYEILNKKGEVVLKNNYQYIGEFSEGMASFINNNKWGYIDKKGNIVIKEGYFYAYYFSEGLAAVRVKDTLEEVLCGFINRDNQMVIKPVFFSAEPFLDGIAEVEIKDTDGKYKTGFIDKNGKYVIKPQQQYYQRVDNCGNGLIMVKNKDNSFSHYIDLKGNIIKPKI